jgi:hypothetical protein
MPEKQSFLFFKTLFITLPSFFVKAQNFEPSRGSTNDFGRWITEALHPLFFIFYHKTFDTSVLESCYFREKLNFLQTYYSLDSFFDCLLCYFIKDSCETQDFALRIQNSEFRIQNSEENKALSSILPFATLRLSLRKV